MQGRIAVRGTMGKEGKLLQYRRYCLYPTRQATFGSVSRGAPPRRETMLWPILFVLLVTALVTGFAVFHAAGTLIESLNDHSELD
jgi:multisubunit Na+/H+ antiporter MnhC subunit